MRLYFPVPENEQTCNGTLVRNFLRQCAVSTDLARAVKFRGGGFFADGEPVLANRRVYPGQVVSFELPPEGDGVAPQPDIPVKAVYEDAFAVVLEKPPHLAVHPTLNYPGGTLANGYAAWAAQRGDSIIGRCVTPEGKPSRTEYTILKAENGLSLAACVPVTGRTHQIRVHFASIGHPLAGDDLYGGSRERIGRQALHCALQTFRVPEYTDVPGGVRIRVPVNAADTRSMTVESPLPEDMTVLFW